MVKTSLDIKIDELNAQICDQAKYTHKLSGLVFEVNKGKEKINIDIENNPIIFDDKFDVFIYHKLRDINFELIQERGKKKIYNARATVDAISFSIFRNFHDLLIEKFSKNHELEIKSIDYDSYKILSSETGKDSFAFDKRFIFSLKYTILFKTECKNICLQ